MAEGSGEGCMVGGPGVVKSAGDGCCRVVSRCITVSSSAGWRLSRWRIYTAANGNGQERCAPHAEAPKDLHAILKAEAERRSVP